MKLKWILAILLVFSARVSFAAHTTLRFSIPEVPDNPIKEYPSEQIYQRFEESINVGPRGLEQKVKKRRFQAPYKVWDKTFGSGTPVHDFFVHEIADGLSGIEQQVKDAASRSGDVNRIGYVNIDAKPLEITLAVRGNKVLFHFSNLGFEVKARMGLHGEAKLVCGSNIWAKVKGKIVVDGEYDLYSGLVSANSIDMNESIDADCNRPLGRVFDFAIDRFAEKALKDAVGDFVKPVLRSTVQLASLNQVFYESAREAESYLGYNFIDDAWSAVQRLTDGLTLTFRIGVDQFGGGNHFLEFVVYQDPTEYYQEAVWVLEKVKEERGRYGTNITTRNVRKYLWHFDCPYWASELKTFNILPVQTGTRVVEETVGNARTGFKKIQHVLPVYGRYRFLPVDYGLSNYVESSGLQFGLFSQCKSYNGLYSPLDARQKELDGWL